MIEGPFVGSGDRDVYAVQDTNGQLVCELPVQPSDIDTRIAFSYIRVFYSVIGVLLAISDIPRTGFSISLFTYYPSVGPGTAMFYGPYAYPVVHFNHTNAAVTGSSGDSPIESVDLWSYKFDSLSIPTRALAEHLGVKSYPACVLYKEPCEGVTLAIRTVFDMMNDLMDAVEERYFAKDSQKCLPLVFTTTSYWADRLHHVLLGKFGYRVDSRTHTVHHFVVAAGAPLGLNVCKPRSRAAWHRPHVCNCAVAWRCDHPTLGSDVQVSVATSIFLRVAALQQQYPNTTVDLTLITTRSRVQSQKLLFPTAFFASDNTEVTTIIRGRHPEHPSSTVFLDDYRYERATAETSAEDISAVTGKLRGLSQGYIWLRVLPLLCVSYQVRLAEAKHRHVGLVMKVRVILATFLRVPSHTIMYGSWLPIVAYSIAHFIDCSLVHLLSDNFWSTINGLFTFNLVTFIRVSSILMRNIWLIVLFWKSTMTVHNHVFRHRSRPWRPHDGLVTFRGSFMGAMSSLTIFAFLRAIRFRDSRVLGVSEIARNAGDSSYAFSRSHIDTVSDFGFRQDLKIITTSSAVVTLVVLLIRAMTRGSRGPTTSSFFCQSFYVPLSAGKLYPASGLNPFWYMKLQPVEKRAQAPFKRPSMLSQLLFFAPRVMSLIVPFRREPKKRTCEVCDFIPMPLHWRTTQGCRRHEKIFNISQRSVEMHSMVRLTHIGMFSDPIAYFRIGVLGKPLFLYRITPRLRKRRHQTTPKTHTGSITPTTRGAVNRTHVDEPDILLLLPLMIHESGRTWSKYDPRPSDIHLIAIVRSSTVPWSLLADCG